MTVSERFTKALAGDLSIDRLPVIEWAGWWNLTLDRWAEEGLTRDMDSEARYHLLGLDPHRQFWFSTKDASCPRPARHGGGIIEDESDYERILPHLYPIESESKLIDSIGERDDIITWFTLSGGFWFPRELFGIEGHLYSFYDQPELYDRILNDLADYQMKLLQKLYTRCTPQFMTFAEDMSYNKGPMLSKKLFDRFLLPYYKKLVPFIRSHGTRVLVDSDGDITEMIPWLMEAGIEGALPLEYQAGVDITKIKRLYPSFLMIGGFNKRIMKDGEEAMEKEFRRILPVMRTGGYIPAVDHQTPPDVSLENYRIFVKLLEKYCRVACETEN